MASPQCPSCRRDVQRPPANKSFPFCSERCRAIDLGKWLGEEFRIPTRQVEEDEDGDALSRPDPQRPPFDA
ncbi:MAG: DNA gyrase inhibitor YacG [Myxococcaceae bacterium]|nr:DNA gyrase inhibitor YacG [Myxococcaceae bacterium]